MLSVMQPVLASCSTCIMFNIIGVQACSTIPLEFTTVASGSLLVNYLGIIYLFLTRFSEGKIWLLNDVLRQAGG